MKKSSKAVKKARKLPVVKKAKPAKRPVKKAADQKKALMKALKKAAGRIRKAATQKPAQAIESPRNKTEETKYYPRPTPYLPPRQWEHEELPERYGDTRIVIMARDPYWIFAYWEVTDERRMQVEREAGASWNEMRKVLRVYDVTGKDFNGFNANRYFDIDLHPGATSWYINVGASDRSWCVDFGVITPGGKFIVIARSNIVMTPRDSASDVIDEEWMSIEEEFLKLYGLWGGFAGASGKAKIKKIMKERLQKELSSGGLSSFVRPPNYKGRGFWMVVNTELIVYGATEPDATVTVQDRPIKLNRDGTFSLRFALPDGEQVIPVKGISADKEEERTITPIVKKFTR